VLGRPDVQAVNKVKNHGTKPLTNNNTEPFIREATDVFNAVRENYNTIQVEETDDAKKAQHETDFDDCEALFDEARDGLQASLDSFPPDPTTSTGSGGGSSSGIKIKLPTLHVPTFSGDASDWITFRDMFRTSIHNNKEIKADHIRMTYLQSLLTGNAAKLIKSMPISDANYPVAWDIVQKRYENKRHLFTNVMRKFINTPTVVQDNPTS